MSQEIGLTVHIREANTTFHLTFSNLLYQYIIITKFICQAANILFLPAERLYSNKKNNGGFLNDEEWLCVDIFFPYSAAISGGSFSTAWSAANNRPDGRAAARWHIISILIPYCLIFLRCGFFSVHSCHCSQSEDFFYWDIVGELVNFANAKSNGIPWVTALIHHGELKEEDSFEVELNFSFHTLGSGMWASVIGNYVNISNKIPVHHRPGSKFWEIIINKDGWID